MQAADILSDPHWFPVHFDLQQDTLTFLQTTRDSLSKGAFLDHRFYQQTDRFHKVRLSHALNCPLERHDMSWIFHTAFCASTLMARALDVHGKTLALKEPDILMQLANTLRMAKREGRSLDAIKPVCDCIFSLLSRRFSDQERVLIKPTNPANFLMTFVLGRGDPALFMTSPLKVFLTSILRKGEEGAAFIRSLYNIFALDGTGLSKISERDALRFTDMQITAMIWQHQHEDMTDVAKMYPDQVRAIDGLSFPLDPTRHMKAASDFLKLGLGDEDIAQNANGTVFEQNAKFSDQSFDTATRDAENARLENMFADRLTATINWQAKLDLGRDYTYLPAAPLL
ncbi:MAG: hypothetical protein AAGI14_10480 [Pseudomonadota bacterium]